MTFEFLDGSGAALISLRTLDDQRGAFARVWCARAFQDAGIDFVPVQANSSITVARGTVRGMHFQREPGADAKLVRCSAGAIHDVIVDLRPWSRTYTKAFAVELSPANDRILYVPQGFAHGFQTLSADVRVEYLMGAFYDPALSDGFRHDDPAIAITWPLPVTLRSGRDAIWAPLVLHGTGRGRPA